MRPPLALITGASRGIGRATLLALAERGLRLALIGREGPEQHAARELGVARGAPDATFISADLGDPAQAERAGALVLESVGVPDVVVHNAGVVVRASIEQLSLADWQLQLAVNLSSPFALTRALLPAMRTRGTGRILFVASISSTLGSPRQSAYAAAKWGVVGFMKSLAEELTDSGLMTAALLPGSVATRMLEGSGFAPRMQPEDVARTLVYYALEAPLAHNGAVVEMFGV